MVSRLIMPQYRFSWHQLDWWSDPEFNAYLRRFDDLDGFNTQRKWMAWQLLRLTASVEGDTAECGVLAGASSWLICAANRHRGTPNQHHLFDSFEGLSEPNENDGDYWSKGALAVSDEVVARNLAPFADMLVFHKGWIPDRFPDVADRRFSFVHVDVDLEQPTRDSLEFFYDKLNPGGIFLCDDYAFGSCPGATKAIDEFLDDKVEKMIKLDSGGGFFMKGIRTAADISPAAAPK